MSDWWYRLAPTSKALVLFALVLVLATLVVVFVRPWWHRANPTGKALLVSASVLVFASLVVLLTPWPIAHYTGRSRCGAPLLNHAPKAERCAELRNYGLLLASPALVIATVLGAWAVIRNRRRSDER